MRKLLFAILLLPGVYGHAQKRANPKMYANTITPADLKQHLYIIAGKEMEGRETATEGQRRAAAYIENQFRVLGLTRGMGDSYQMEYPVYQDSMVNASVEVNGKRFEQDEDFTVNLFSAYTATLMGSEVVFVGRGLSDSTEDDYKNINAAGKIVLVWAPSGAPSRNSRRMRFAIQEAAQKNGAAAILIVQDDFPHRSASTKGLLTVNAFRRTIYPNTFYISENIAKEILKNDFDAVKASVKNNTIRAKSYDADVLLAFEKAMIKKKSSNVIGVLEGTDKKNEYLVISAHYDHLGKRGDSVIYYGADDDGSGTVSILELAQAFVEAKKAGHGPRRSIIFMTVSGEEKGLWGSAYYGDHPAFPLDSTTADLNIDMIGRIDPKRTHGDSLNYVYVVGDDKLSTDLRPINEAMNKKYTKLELDYKYNDPKDPERIYYRSDHFNFARKGVPIIFYFNGTHNDYHRPTDTPDKINYDLLSKRAQLVFYTAWEMANREAMLKRDLKL